VNKCEEVGQSDTGFFGDLGDTRTRSGCGCRFVCAPHCANRNRGLEEDHAGIGRCPNADGQRPRC
jgi:hypothetical protein